MNFFRGLKIKINNVGVFCKVHANSIAVYGGLTGMVVGTGGIAWATAKTVKDKYENPDKEKKERVGDAAKRFVGPALLFIGGTAAVVAGHRASIRALSEASAAFAALASANAVLSENADPLDKFEKVETTKTYTDENGIETTEIKKTLSIPENSFMCVYDADTSEEFDDSYDEEPGVHTKETVFINLKYLERISQKWTTILRERAGLPVYWNEIRSIDLGMKNVKGGQFAGWHFDPNDETRLGDNYIDLRAQAIPNRKLGIDNDGYTIVIDPNFDGNVIPYEEEE